jgi:ribosomal peptide maturation radical SAM protein 1
MPFAQLFMPSIGLGLLKAGLSEAVPTKVVYFAFRFAELIGPVLYCAISAGMPANHDLAGEWAFSHMLFDQSDSDVEQYIENVLRGAHPSHAKSDDNRSEEREDFINQLLEVRGKVDAFLDECVEEVLSYNPRIVGFTSVFQQQVASLSLAKRLKQQRPEVFIVFGGANCEGPMGAEVIRQFPFVDCVVSGEGDLVFPELVRRVRSGLPISDLQGVVCRENIDRPLKNAPSVTDMDLLPIPDFQDYFEGWEASHLDLPVKPRLLFETSRGCWWGEKNHCTFCGLNGMTMAFRSKSPERAMSELLHLVGKYPGHPVSVVDNILDYRYFKDFIPALAERGLDLELFYEVKANLRKEQVRALRDAGITMIQPGVESLSDGVLRLMRKGVRALQNIQLLKWCKELGVTPLWNFIWGFPRESPQEYARMAEMLPLLTHLPPPGSAARIRLDRFSPNYDDSEQLGFTNVSPYPTYSYIYRLSPEAVAGLAYYFSYEYTEPQEVASYVGPLAQEVLKWIDGYATSDLFWVDKGTHLLIWDLRLAAEESLTVLAGEQRFLYMACDQTKNIRQLHELWLSQFAQAPDVVSIEAHLQTLVSKGLVIKDGDSYLSLAIPLGEYTPKKEILQKLLATLEAMGAYVKDDDTLLIDSNRYLA